MRSEFGKGLAICIVKFAEHMENDMARRISHVHFWHEKLKGDESKLKEYDRSLGEAVRIFQDVELHVHKKYDKAFSSMLEMWANGASDHLYEIESPKNKDWFLMRCPKIAEKVAELKDLALTMGHGFEHERTWTWEDFCRLQELTREVALEIDRGLGLKPELGRW